MPVPDCVHRLSHFLVLKSFIHGSQLLHSDLRSPLVYWTWLLDPSLETHQTDYHHHCSILAQVFLGLLLKSKIWEDTTGIFTELHSLYSKKEGKDLAHQLVP